MDSLIDPANLATILAQLGFSAVFFYLYTRERADRAEAQKELIDTLREIAGLRQQLLRNESYMAGRMFQAEREPSHDTQPLAPIRPGRGED